MQSPDPQIHKQTTQKLLGKRTGILVFVLLFLSFLTLYHQVIAKLVNDWSVDENYSHGFLVVPLALYFAWERRNKFLQTTRHPHILGLLMVLCSLAVLLVGILGAEVFSTEISMIGVIAGSVWFLFGWQHLKVMLFPIAFLLLMVPIPALVFNEITLPLQFIASRFAEGSLILLGVPVLREGNVIHLPNIVLEVEEACSGIRSMVSLLTLGIVYGYFSESRQWMRVVLALATIPVAILTNGIRVAGTGAAALQYGAQAAEGFLHTFSGWFVFISACMLLLLCHRTLSWFFPLARSSQKPQVRDVTRAGHPLVNGE